MKTNSRKDKINLTYILLGLLFTIYFFLPNENDILNNEVKTITVIASHDIQKIGGKRSEYEYRFQTNEYLCSFVINTSGAKAAHWHNLDNITKNDTLTIKIHNSRLLDLNNKAENILIYALSKNNNQIYDTDNYNISKNSLGKRWKIIFIISGILFIFRGLTIISSKTTYILAGLSAATIIMLRLLKMYW